MDIFSEGMAAVCRDDSLWGYIDTEGNEVIPCMYNRHVGCFTEGLACVPSNEGNGIKFINKKKRDHNRAHPTNPVECCADANPKTMLPNDT